MRIVGKLFMPLRSLERYAMVCMTGERTRSCGTSSLPESRITRTKQVRAPPSSKYNDDCDPASCQRDHEIERPSRVAVTTDGEQSHVVRIPALQSLWDWFAAWYSGFVLLDAYSIRDGVPRQTFPFPLARFIRSLPKSPLSH